MLLSLEALRDASVWNEGTSLASGGRTDEVSRITELLDEVVMLFDNDVTRAFHIVKWMDLDHVVMQGCNGHKFYMQSMAIHLQAKQ